MKDKSSKRRYSWIMAVWKARTAILRDTRLTTQSSSQVCFRNSEIESKDKERKRARRFLTIVVEKIALAGLKELLVRYCII